jgi:hypothetical protein
VFIRVHPWLISPYLFANGASLADKRGVRVVLLLICCLAVGCTPKGRGLADEDVAFKAPAIKEAVAERQKKAVPQLVKDLDDDDAAVRFYAIEGLRRLTGRTFDYRYYDDAAARRPAVATWKQWLSEQGQ